MRAVRSEARRLLGALLVVGVPFVTGRTVGAVCAALHLAQLQANVLMASAVVCQALALVGVALRLLRASDYGGPTHFELHSDRVLAYYGVSALGIAGSVCSLSGLPVAAAALAWPVAGGVLLFVFRPFFFPGGDHLRGRRLLGSAEAAARTLALRPRSDPGLPWGGVVIPSRLAVLHFLVVGAPGSGKTLTIRMLLGTLVGQISRGSGRRALVYDAKRDTASILAGMKPTVPVLLLNPFDARSVRWAIARDVTSPAACLQVAEALVRTEEGPNQFFSLAGIEIVAGVMMAFHLACPGGWTLRDVILAVRNPEVLQSILSQHPQTAGPLIHFAEARVLANILSTIRVRFAQLEPVAACWDHSPADVSFEDWVREEGILVLGNDEAARVTLDALNRAMLRRLVELVLNGPEVDDWRTAFVLDEVAQAGKLDCLSALLTKGRSKGAAVVMGFQDIDGFRQVYGKGADELVGQCGVKAILRAESPGTAEWAGKLIGEVEAWEHDVTSSAGGDSTSHRRVKREAALASEFLSLPPATRPGGVSGYYIVPEVGAFRQTVPPRVVSRLLHPKGDAADFVPRPVEEQYLRPWDAGDLARLGLDRAGHVPHPSHAATEPRAEKLRVVRSLRDER